jgi:CcmD family protein
MSHVPYLIAAYAVIFVTIGGYLGFIASRQKRISRELDSAEAQLAALKAAHPAPQRSARA